LARLILKCVQKYFQGIIYSIGCLDRHNVGGGQEAFDVMRVMIERLAAEGRLTTNAETATRTIWAASNGVLSLFMQRAPLVEITATARLLFDALIAS
jgi:hypothetical protein